VTEIQNVEVINLRISGITPTKPLPIRWFDPWNLIRSRGLGFGISPRATTVSTMTNPRPLLPFLLVTTIYDAMTVTPFWSMMNMVYPSWTTREREVGAKTRREDDAYPKNLERTTSQMTMAVDDGGGRWWQQTLNPLFFLSYTILSFLYPGKREAAVYGVHPKNDGRRRVRTYFLL